MINSSANSTSINLMRVAIFIVPAVVVIILIIFGNFLVVVAVIRVQKLRRQIQNWFIVSLAMSDFLVGLLIMPISLTFEVLDSWILGQTMCDLWLALDVLFVTASILNLCLISLDRYWSIVHTIAYLNHRTPARAFGMIAAVWIMALTISFPPLVGWKADLAVGECGLSTDPGYVCYSALGSFFLPVIVLIFVYGRIFMISRRRNRARRAAAKKTCETMLASRVMPDCSTALHTSARERDSVKPESPAGKNYLSLPRNSIGIASNTLKQDSNVETVPMKDFTVPLLQDAENTRRFSAPPTVKLGIGQSREDMNEDQLMFLKKQKKLRRKDLRATLILGIVLFSFMLCWFPFFTLYILGSFGIGVPEKVFDVIFWLGYCNSAFNPLIYTVMNKDFKRAFKRILTCRGR